MATGAGGTGRLKSEVFDGIESLLGYLAGKLSDFPSYVASEAYQIGKERLIPSASRVLALLRYFGESAGFQTLSALYAHGGTVGAANAG